MRRTSYQYGTLQLVGRKRGPAVWVLRIRENGKRKAIQLGTIERLKTEAAAQRAADRERARLSAHQPCGLRFGALVERYLREELPERKSTSRFYKSWINNHILPKWGDVPAETIAAEPIEVEHWLKELDLSPKSRAHIRSLMGLIFNCGMRWGVLPREINPMSLVRVRGADKPLKRRRVIMPEEFWRMMPHLAQPYRTMAILAYVTGLRVSELAALKWSDFDSKLGTMHIQRAVVLGTVDEVKTLASDAFLPAGEDVQNLLLDYRRTCAAKSEWLFPSPLTGHPYSTTHIQSGHIEPAGRKAGLGPGIGWHNFRHSYSTILRALKVDMKVQQALMRHAHLSTTMDLYTETVDENLQQAHALFMANVLTEDGRHWLQAEASA